MFARSLKLSQTNSFFLFGARGTGKTTLVRQAFGSDALYIDLLDPGLLADLQAHPERLRARVVPALEAGRWVVIDEVQKVPELLDLVHQLIEKYRAKFALTGSSARKLRRGASNLLAGRAFTHRLFPLTPQELGEQFNLSQALTWGTLPQIYAFDDDQDRYRYLQAYVETYLQEEIVAEQIVRKLPPFRRFLEVAAQTNGEIVNYSKMGREIAADPVSVKTYFQILEDTLLGFHLDPYHASIRKRQRQSPKFYLVDAGIVRAQARRLDVPVNERTFAYGKLFESLVINTIRARLEYIGRQYRLSYLQTKDGAEVDLVIEREPEGLILIEIKSATHVYEEDVVNLKRFAKDIDRSRALCLYNGSEELKFGNVRVLPWLAGVQELGL